VLPYSSSVGNCEFYWSDVATGLQPFLDFFGTPHPNNHFCFLPFTIFECDLKFLCLRLLYESPSFLGAVVCPAVHGMNEHSWTDCPFKAHKSIFLLEHLWILLNSSFSRTVQMFVRGCQNQNRGKLSHIFKAELLN